MFKSIQWKIVLIYALLILLAMQFFAVFITRALERYYLNTYAASLESQGLLLATFLQRHLVADEEGATLDRLVGEFSRYAGTSEILVLDSFGRVLSSSRPDSDVRGQRIIQEEIARALTGSRSEEIRLDPVTRERAKYLALPVRSGEKTLGVVYLAGSLEPIYRTLREIQYIFLIGALLVICATVLLGFVLAKTITGPIKEVTGKAARIARGDFGQRLLVRSGDEIGHLTEMFNYLSAQLEATLRKEREFVANVSHELRTPLTTLKSYTETLLAGAMHEPAVCRSFLTTMERETDRMVRLVKDLLALTQHDYHQVRWQKRKQSLDGLIREVVGELEPGYRESGRSIKLSLPPEPVQVVFDRDKIKQVLLNLLQNAFQYTARDGKIDVSLAENGDQAVITVRDNGIGLQQDEITRIFERFYRVDKARSRDQGGTGLGLSIAREIVHGHGGSICVDSEPARFTMVTVMLPRALCEKGMVTNCGNA
jgi:signal transduction histidine kinase